MNYVKKTYILILSLKFKKNLLVLNLKHIQKLKLFLEKNKNLLDETYTYLNLEFEQVDELLRRTIDDCTQCFHRFKYICALVVKFIKGSHNTTSYLELTKISKKLIRGDKGGKWIR